MTEHTHRAQSRTELVPPYPGEGVAANLPRPSPGGQPIVNNFSWPTPPRPPSVGVRPYSTAGGRELRLAARPPARFSWLRSQETVNQEQTPWGNTLLAQRYPLSGNSYFWRTGFRQRAALARQRFNGLLPGRASQPSKRLEPGTPRSQHLLPALS